MCIILYCIALVLYYNNVIQYLVLHCTVLIHTYTMFGATLYRINVLVINLNYIFKN